MRFILLIPMVAASDHSRYLQHLASTRLQHLERIRTFTNRRLARMSKLSQDQQEFFSRSFTYISFAALEASAIQLFADGLSCVRGSPAILYLTDYVHSFTPCSHISRYCQTHMDPFPTAPLPFVMPFVCDLSRPCPSPKYHPIPISSN